MKALVTGGTCLLAIAATLSGASPNQPLENQPATLWGDMSTVPVAVWVALIGLIALDVIARRSSSGK